MTRAGVRVILIGWHHGAIYLYAGLARLTGVNASALSASITWSGSG